MSRIKLLAVLATLLLIATSCQDKVPVAPIKAGSVRNFPNALGSGWVYHVIDNLQPVDPNKPDYVIDTVTVTIDRYVTDPQTGFADTTLWSYMFNGNTAQQYPERLVVINGDTVYMYWNWRNSDIIGLIFPFDIRDSWQTGGLLSGDKTTVTDTTSLRVGAGMFPKVYVLENERRTSISADSRIATLWFVPDLGIIKMHFHEVHSQSVGDTTWELVYHNNPDF